MEGDGRFIGIQWITMDREKSGGHVENGEDGGGRERAEFETGCGTVT